uniref:Uncharacterized protein n=1 Tax=Amphimedon queenslandica TaxID=400682 RepID=A0A1X7VTL6_AMPQE
EVWISLITLSRGFLFKVRIESVIFFGIASRF